MSLLISFFLSSLRFVYYLDKPGEDGLQNSGGAGSSARLEGY